MISGALAKKVKVFDYGKRIETVTLPFLYPSENQILAMHPLKRRREHDKFQQSAGMFLKAQHIEPFKKPVRILLDLCFKTNRRRDNDNYIGKWLLDAIVKAGILPDDSTAYIPDAPDILILAGEDKNQIVMRIEEL